MIAELGPAYIYRFTDTLDKEIQNSAAYIDGSSDRLRRDKRFIVHASEQAKQTVDRILNLTVTNGWQVQTEE